MKKVTLTLFSLLLLSGFFILPSSVLAQNAGNNNAGNGGNQLQKPTQTLTNETFDALNPLNITNSDAAESLSTPAGIINRVVVFAFPLAGIILFVMIVWAGFEIVAGGGSKKAQDAGKQRLTSALIGFGLLFVSYWIVQIVEVVFNVAIL